MNKVAVVMLVFTVWAMTNICLAETRVNINTATALELQTLPGIGPGMAQLILDFRQSNGPFKTIEDLLKVPRMGQKTFDVLKNHITVDSPPPNKVEGQDSKELEFKAVEGPTPTPLPSVEEVMAMFEWEPSIQDVQRAAIKFAEIDAYRFEMWRRKVKEKGLWPDVLQVSVAHKTDDDYDYTRASTIGISGGTAYVGPDKETWKNSTDSDFDYQFRLRWKIQDYCFNSDMLRVSSETERQVKFRQSIIEDVTKLYYDRRRLQVDMILQPDVQTSVKIRQELQLEELTAAIDGLTGGYFSEALNKTH
ncbi:MAG: helix-hairpin-helix domain-containing protein [bacterium]